MPHSPTKIAFAEDAVIDRLVSVAYPLPVTVVEGGSGGVSTGTITAIASLATSQQVLAANTARKGVLAVNTDANAVLLKYGATASATSVSVRIPGGYGQWTMDEPIYEGRIDAIWEADGTGSLYVTEL